MRSVLYWMVILVVLAALLAPAQAEAQSARYVIVTGVASCRSGASAAGATLYLQGTAGYVYAGGTFRLMGRANSSGTISYGGQALRSVYVGQNGTSGVRLVLPC